MRLQSLPDQWRSFRRVNQHGLNLMSFLKVDTILLFTEDFAVVGVKLLCTGIQWKVDILRLHGKNELVNLSCWQTVNAI